MISNASTREKVIAGADPVDVQIWLELPSWDRIPFPLPGGPAPVIQPLFRVPPGMTLEAHEFCLGDIRAGEIADVIWRVQGRTANTVNLGPPLGPHYNLGVGYTLGNIRTELLTTRGLQSPHVESILSWNRGTPWGEFPRTFPENAILSVKAWNYFEDHHVIYPQVHDYSGDIVLVARLTGLLYFKNLDMAVSTTAQGLQRNFRGDEGRIS